MEPLELTGATERIALETMRELVYGRPPRRRLPTRLIFVAVVLSMYGCATGSKPPAAEVETVGQLAPSYASIAVAPLKHDAPPELGGVAGSDDDAPAPADTSLDVLRREAAAGGAVDVAPKTDGVTPGTVR